MCDLSYVFIWACLYVLWFLFLFVCRLVRLVYVCILVCVYFSVSFLSSFPYSVGRPVFLTFLVSISLSVCPSRFLFHVSNHARTYVSFVSINVLPSSCLRASFFVRCVCCVFCVPIFLPYQGSWSHNTRKVNRVVGLVGLVGWVGRLGWLGWSGWLG